MAFNMSNATNARSTAGIRSLATNYENDVKKVINAIKGDKYTTLKNTIKNYWQGVDCDYFLNQLDSEMTEIQNQIKSYTSQITNALTQENNDFRKFQEQNKF